MALLAHTTRLKIGSIMLDCSIVSEIDTKGMDALAKVYNGLASIMTILEQHEGGKFPIRSNVALLTVESHRRIKVQVRGIIAIV